MSGHFATQLGDPEAARLVIRRAHEHVPAYRRFLQKANVSPDTAIEALPTTDKHHYLLDAPYVDLLADDYQQTFTIFRSSGSSGHSFYWPQLKDQQKSTAAGLRFFLEATFDIQRRKSLLIVGLALGSWIGGDHISWALKSAAIGCPYPLSVFSPGNHHDEIIEMIRNADSFVDQFIIFVCPSAIGHLLLRAQQIQRALPLAKMRYVVIGEPFPETVRMRLSERAGLAADETSIVSVYGSADTGVLGVESRASVAIRQLLSEQPALARELGFTPPIPHFFHCVADAYLEAPQGELLITRWQGIPLLRYNLHDAALLVRYRELRERLLAARLNKPMSRWIAEHELLPDMLAITGRADRCLILCGTNLTEAMLDEAVKCPELADELTGMYRARIIYEEGRQRLALALEFRAAVNAEPALIDEVYRKLATALGRVQPEFQDDWQNVYHAWDDDREHRILKIEPLPWPALSGEAAIKQRGITG